MFFSKLFNTNRARDKQNELNSIIKEYPMTSTPVVPGILKHQVEFKAIRDLWGVQRLGFTLAHEGSDLVEPKSLEVIRKKLLGWFQHYPKLKEHFKTALPRNLIAISFPQVYFSMGKSCQEFQLSKDLKAPENAFFTYRKVSECIQCTYYNVDGVEYLAGTTFYPAPHGAPKLLPDNGYAIWVSVLAGRAYPPQNRYDSHIFKKSKVYGRMCQTAGQLVVVDCKKNDGVPRHIVLDPVTKKHMEVLCKECVKDHFTYKWEEPKKDLPAAKVVPAAVQEAPPAPFVSEQISPSEAPVPVTEQASSSESSAVSRVDSTESLLEGFEKIDVKGSGGDDDSYIDAELIDY